MSVPPDNVDLARRLGREVVLVGVDGSVGGLHALWHARGIADTRVAQLVVVFVHDLPAAAVIGAVGVGGTGRCRMRCVRRCCRMWWGRDICWARVGRLPG